MPKDATHFEKLNEMLRAYRTSNILFSAFELKIFELFSDGKLSFDQIRPKTKCSPRGLKMLLDALVALGLIRFQKNNYELRPEYSDYLNSRSEKYIGGMLSHEMHLSKRWQNLTKSVRSGKPAKKKKEQSKKDTKRFINAMADIGKRSADMLLDAVNFKGTEHLLDLGGGPGKYLAAFCEKYPHAQATLFDQPASISTAKKQLKKHPAFSRMHFIKGDIFKDSIGGEYDIILVSNVIHIFGANENKRIFKKCFKSLTSGGRLLVKDFISNISIFDTQFALHMLLSTKTGQCYSEQELYDLMIQAGLKKGKTIKMTESSFILEGIK